MRYCNNLVNIRDTISVIDSTLPAWVDKFPGLKDVNDPCWMDIANRAIEVVIPANHYVVRDGDICKDYLLILDGLVTIFKSFENGREMLLYRIHGGESCSLTTTGLLTNGIFVASARTETKTRAMVIPKYDFDQAFDKSRGFRNFVCDTFGGRILEFMSLLESIATKNTGVRLARWLLESMSDKNTVATSHKNLAFEIGTAREVISRHLKDFEARGWVNLARKNIELTNVDELREFSVRSESAAK